ncbi:unnamed protein product, partial [Meganyctiphanes norvegica]
NEVWTAYQGAGVGVACPFCGKVFHQRYSFVNHYRTHTGLKPFVCPYCNHGFIQKGNLKTHILRHHSKTDGDPKSSFPSTFIPRKTSKTLITALPSPILPPPGSILSSNVSPTNIPFSNLQVALPNLPITPTTIPISAFPHSHLHNSNPTPTLAPPRSFSPTGLLHNISPVAPSSPSPDSRPSFFESPSRNDTPPLSLVIYSRELREESRGSDALSPESRSEFLRVDQSPARSTTPLQLQQQLPQAPATPAQLLPHTTDTNLPSCSPKESVQSEQTGRKTPHTNFSYYDSQIDTGDSQIDTGDSQIVTGKTCNTDMD